MLGVSRERNCNVYASEIRKKKVSPFLFLSFVAIRSYIHTYTHTYIYKVGIKFLGGPKVLK